MTDSINITSPTPIVPRYPSGDTQDYTVSQHVYAGPAVVQLRAPELPPIPDNIPASPYDLTDKWLGEPVAPDWLLARFHLERYQILVRQLGIKRKIGTLIMPDQVVDAQRWTHGLVLIVKCGPGVFAGKRFEDMGLSVEDAPKPGDVCGVESRIAASRRNYLLGQEYFILPDDCGFFRIDREVAHLVDYKV